MLGSFIYCRIALQKWKSLGSGVILLLAGICPASAAVPADSAARNQVVGQPVALLVQPAAVTLAGPRAMQQLVVSGRYADGTLRDLTPFCELTARAGH